MAIELAGVSLTAQQPEINVARVALQAMAAVLGGTNSLHTNSLDEALALPTEKAALIALRTQQIIAAESGVTNTIDPLAGSFFVEALTDETERQAVAYINQIRELGGVLECIRNGFLQKEIAEASYRFQQEVEARQRVIVGVNDYVMDEETPVPTLYVDPAKERIHLERLSRVRRERDNERVGVTLKALEQATRGGENTMPYILDRARLCHDGGDHGCLPHGLWRVYRNVGVLRSSASGPKCIGRSALETLLQRHLRKG